LLFNHGNRMEQDFEDLTCPITMECGKTRVEARGETRRVTEKAEIARGTPALLIESHLKIMPRLLLLKAATSVGAFAFA